MGYNISSVIFYCFFYYISFLDIKDKHYLIKLSFSLLSLAILPYTGIIDMCITQDFNIIFPYFYNIHALFLLFTTGLSINGLVWKEQYNILSKISRILSVFKELGIIDMCITQDFDIIFPYFYNIYAYFYYLLQVCLLTDLCEKSNIIYYLK